ncbi:MAG: ATP-binding cassette domain-containing protein [Chloroflexota bacterium]
MASERAVQAELSLAADRIDAGYGSHLVVKAASLRVTPGQVVCLLGPNGAGKSTLLKALVGIVHISSGTVRLGESDVTNRRTEALAALGIAYVPQLDDVFGPMTVSENLEMGGFMLSRDALRARMDVTLQEFPTLAALRTRRAATLSGGERKVLAIARALMMESRVLLLDEPTAGLSPSVAASVLADVTRTCSMQGTGVLVVEQRARAALELSHWAHVMVGGQVRVSESARSLLERDDLGDLLIGASATAKPPARGEDE